MQLAFDSVTDDLLVADQGNDRVEALDATPPSCMGASTTTSFNGSVTLQVQCTSLDQQTQHLQIVSLPAHSSVTLKDGQFTSQGFEPSR